MRKVELQTGVRCPCGENKSIDRADESNPGSSDESPGIAERSSTLPTHYYSIPPKSQAQSHRIRQGDWAYTLGSEGGNAAERPAAYEGSFRLEFCGQRLILFGTERRNRFLFWLEITLLISVIPIYLHSAAHVHTSLMKGLAVPNILGDKTLSCIGWSVLPCLRRKAFKSPNPAALVLLGDRVIKVTFPFCVSAGQT